MEAAERMGKPCFECSLSFQMSYEKPIQRITAPCQAMFQETPIREAESFLWSHSDGTEQLAEDKK